jgi:hypothetical protein
VRLSEFTRDASTARVAGQLAQGVLRTHTQWALGRAAAEHQLALSDRPERQPLVDDAWFAARSERWDFPATLGAGVVARGDGSVVPTIFVRASAVASARADELPLGRPVLAAEVPWGRALADTLAPGDPDASVHVMAMTDPLPFFSPAASVNGPGTRGTFGAAVTTEQGEDAILTAGHVAPAGSRVRDPSDVAATVSFSVDPGAMQGVGPSADVAVCVPIAGNTARSPSCPISGPGQGSPGGVIDVHGAETGTQSTRVMGFTPYLYVPSMAGMWAQLYFTIAAASQPGDSGAPVLADGDKLIGHLVGGSAPTTSFVQALDVQLAASRTTLRP